VFFECAQALAKRMNEVRTGSARAKIKSAFEVCFSRQATAAELGRLEKYYDDQLRLSRAHLAKSADVAGKEMPTDSAIERAADVALARTLMNLDEFVTRE
jgi:hypothetical protein